MRRGRQGEGEQGGGEGENGGEGEEKKEKKKGRRRMRYSVRFFFCFCIEASSVVSASRKAESKECYTCIICPKSFCVCNLNTMLGFSLQASRGYSCLHVHFFLLVQYLTGMHLHAAL